MVKFLFKMKNKGITTMNIGELLLVANLSTYLFTSALRYPDLILSSLCHVITLHPILQASLQYVTMKQRKIFHNFNTILTILILCFYYNRRNDIMTCTH